MSAKECLEALVKKKKNLLTTTENTTEKYIPKHEKSEKSQQSKLVQASWDHALKEESIYSSRIP